MPYCIKCAKEIQEDWSICPFCGTPNVLSKNEDNIDKDRDFVAENESEQITEQSTVRESGGNYGHKNLDDLEPGTILDGKYRIEEKLGKGGFGTVYKAWYAHLESWRAIKVISNEFYDDKEVISDLKREAKKLDKINDTHIVRLYDVHLDGALKYFDMEYVDGGDLVDLKLSYPDKQVPEEKVWDIARQFSQGMLAIHKQHIIHKDIKPQNVMLSKDGVIKIMDFGVAEQFRSSRSRIKDASRAGTPVYMSPEHLLGEDVGTESDIWSFGIMLYELLAGKLLYSGQSQTDVLMQIKERNFKPIPHISSKMNDLLEKCLQYDFRDRYRNFEEVLDALTSPSVPNKVPSVRKRQPSSQKKHLFTTKPKEQDQEEQQRKKVQVQKSIVIWLLASFLILLLIPHIYGEASVYFSCAIVIGSGIILFFKQKKNIKEIDTALLWLGINCSLFLLLWYLFEEYNITFDFLNDDESGMMVSSFLTLASGGFLIYFKRGKLDGYSLGVYWLGLILAFHFFIGMWFKAMDVKLWGFYDEEAGFFVSGVIIIASVILLLLKRKHVFVETELLLYWFGLNIVIFNFLLFSFGKEYVTICTISEIVSGLILFFIRRKKLLKIDIALLVFGMIVLSLLFFYSD
jgi:serine/threonine protein kinase